MRLKDKFAVIIGGAIGIGGGITRRFAEEGCNMLITYHGIEEIERVDKLKKELKNYNIKLDFENLEVREKDKIQDVFKKVKKLTDHVDIAINNAGVSTMNNFTELTEEEWDLCMDINAKGMFFCCQEEARIMIKQGYGKIINTSSVSAKRGTEFLVHYSASKGAILSMTFALALELAKYNINVNVVCPGVILTDMIVKRGWDWEAKLRNVDRSKIIEDSKNLISLKRFGEPIDVANLFLFLASDESNYITGQAYNVNGGLESH